MRYSPVFYHDVMPHHNSEPPIVVLSHIVVIFHNNPPIFVLFHNIVIFRNNQSMGGVISSFLKVLTHKMCLTNLVIRHQITHIELFSFSYYKPCYSRISDILQDTIKTTKVIMLVIQWFHKRFNIHQNFLTLRIKSYKFSPMMKQDGFDYMSVSEVARMLRKSNNAVRMLIYRGTLPGYRLGRRLYVRRSDIERAFQPVSKQVEAGANACTQF